MSDRSRRVFPIQVVFTDGEQPTAAKLNGISSQARTGFGVIQYLIGDPWNQAGDPLLSPIAAPNTNALYIPNIARSLGAQDLTNPYLPETASLDSAMIYDDNIGYRYIGLTRGFLRFPWSGSGTPTLAGTFSPLVQVNRKTDPVDVDSTGDWCVLNDKLYTFDPIPTLLRIQYKPTIDEPAIQGSWNVIPDPSTWTGDNYEGVKISYVNDTDDSEGYHIWLPPRRVLEGARFSNINKGGPIEPTDNTAAAPDSGTILLWQDPSDDAALTNGRHYRYNLPSVLTSAAAGDIYPTGYLYLWDAEKGTIIYGTTFSSPLDNTAHRYFKITVTGSTLADILTDFVTDDDTQVPADYIARFKLIVAANSVTQNVSDAVEVLSDHIHDGTDTARVSHSDLAGLVTPNYDASVNPDFPSTSPTFVPTQWTADDHPQYLHRVGTTADSATRRDGFDNAIYNALKISNQTIPTTSGSTILAITTQSGVVKFRATGSANPKVQIAGLADTTNDPYFELDPANDVVSLYNNNGSDGVRVHGASGWIEHLHSIGNNYFDSDLVLGTNGRIYIGGSLGTTGTSYLEKSSATYRFWHSGSSATSNIRAGYFNAENDSGATAGYHYQSYSALQYYHVSPLNCFEVNSSTGIQTGAGSSATQTSLGGFRYRRNTHASNVTRLMTGINLPNGALLYGMYGLITGNDITACTAYLYYYPLLLSSGNTSLGSISRTLSSNAVEISSDFNNAHIVDKGTYTYFVEVTLPAATGTFYWLVINYQMPKVAW